MIVRTNVSRVIANLERLQAETPQAIRRAIAPSAWHKLLASSARAVLRGLAAGEADPMMREALRAYVERVVATLVGSVVAGGTLFQMKAGGDRFGFPVDLWRAGDTALQGGSDGGEFVSATENFEAAKDLVREWVLTEKRLDDYEQRDPEAAVIAIMEILGFVRRPDGQYTERMNEVARDLVEHHLQPFANEHTDAASLGPLDAATAAVWLQAVLATWRELVAAELPGRLAAEFATMRQQLKTTLL